MEINIKINLDNAAFQNGEEFNSVELSRILSGIGRTLSYLELDGANGNLFDYNGNKVGSWEVGN